MAQHIKYSRPGETVRACSTISESLRTSQPHQSPESAPGASVRTLLRARTAAKKSVSCARHCARQTPSRTSI